MAIATDMPADILTGVLVIVTAAAAIYAAVAARAARTSARIARDSLAASMRPIVADVPQDLLTTGEGWNWTGRVNVDRPGGVLLVTVPVRNAGLGPAFLVSASVLAPLDTDPQQSVAAVANPTHRVLRAGETTVVLCRVDPAHEAFTSLDKALSAQFEVQVRYTDLAGSQRTLTTLHVTYHEGRYLARGVDVFACDDNGRPVGEPVIARGPMQDVPVFQEMATRAGTPTVATLYDDMEQAVERAVAAFDKLDRLTKDFPPLVKDMQRWEKYQKIARQLDDGSSPAPQPPA